MTPRRFSIVKPEVLWTGPLGVQLRAQPSDVFRLAAYLLTGPNDLWGIWHLEQKTATLHTGLRPGKLETAFEALKELGFAGYQDEWVYVPELPASQFTKWPLLPTDNNVLAAKAWYETLAENPFLGAWYDRHLVDLHLGRVPNVITRRGGAAVDVPREQPTMPEFDLLGERVSEKALGKTAVDGWFERIVAIYPKKEKLHRARMTLYGLRPNESTMLAMWRALQWQVRQTDWLKHGARYCPSLSAYFKDRRWQDEDRRGPRVNESTLDMLQAAHDFIHEEPPCTEPRKNVRGLPPPSPRLRS